jgi:hypothetical protein
MARKRRTSTVLEMARQRLAGLKSTTQDFGNNLVPARDHAAITNFTNEQSKAKRSGGSKRPTPYPTSGLWSED